LIFEPTKERDWQLTFTVFQYRLPFESPLSDLNAAHSRIEPSELSRRVEALFAHVNHADDIKWRQAFLRSITTPDNLA
jgi:hypothetical protein